MKGGPAAWTALAVGFLIPAMAWVGVRADAGPDESGGRGTDCGTLALYHLLRLEGRPTDLTAIRSHLPAMPPAGYSMKDLRGAARACGLHVSGLRFKRPARELDRPVIAFLRQGHYIVVRPVGHTGKLVQLLNGAEDSTIVDKEFLFAGPGWTGLVLVPRRLGVREWLAVPLASVAGFVLLIRLFPWFRSLAWQRTTKRVKVAETRPLATGTATTDRPIGIEAS